MSATTLHLHFVGGPLDGTRLTLAPQADPDAVSAEKGYRFHLLPLPEDADPHAVCVPMEWSRDEAAKALRTHYARKPGQRGRLSA